MKTFYQIGAIFWYCVAIFFFEKWIIHCFIYIDPKVLNNPFDIFVWCIPGMIAGDSYKKYKNE